MEKFSAVGLVEHGHHRSAQEMVPLAAQHRRASQVNFADAAVAVQRQITHRRQVEQIGIVLAG